MENMSKKIILDSDFLIYRQHKIQSIPLMIADEIVNQ